MQKNCCKSHGLLKSAILRIWKQCQNPEILMFLHFFLICKIPFLRTIKGHGKRLKGFRPALCWSVCECQCGVSPLPIRNRPGGGKKDFKNFERSLLINVVSHTLLKDISIKDQSLPHKIYQDYILFSTFTEETFVLSGFSILK
jgi:hypothetical protein